MGVMCCAGAVNRYPYRLFYLLHRSPVPLSECLQEPLHSDLVPEQGALYVCGGRDVSPWSFLLPSSSLSCSPSSIHTILIEGRHTREQPSMHSSERHDLD